MRLDFVTVVARTVVHHHDQSHAEIDTQNIHVHEPQEHHSGDNIASRYQRTPVCVPEPTNEVSLSSFRQQLGNDEKTLGALHDCLRYLEFN